MGRTELWVSERSVCTRIARAISGQVCLTVCGDGNLAIQDSIRCLVSRMAYKRSLKILTAHSWSDGAGESTDSSTEKPSRISFVALPSSETTECSAIEMAICGSELRAGVLCMCTGEGQMYSRSRTDSQAKTFTVSLRIVKTIFGSLQATASTAFTTWL